MSTLGSFSSSYDAAKLPEKTGKPVDGKYVVSVTSLTLGTAAASGAPMLKWTLKIQAGPYKGRTLYKNNVVSESSMVYLKSDLFVAGFTGRLEQLENPDELLKFHDRYLDVTAKTKGDSFNIFFNRRLSDEEKVAAGGTPF